MASLTGITAERAEEIWNASVVSGVINQSTGRLELTTRGGTILDGGSIINPSMQKAYPIGSIYMNVTAASPAAMFGFGTWVRWGQGRVPVGWDSAQTEFDTSEETGGSKTHTHTEGDLVAAVGSTGGNTETVGYQAVSRNARGPASITNYTVVGSNTYSTSRAMSHHTGVYGTTDPATNLQPYVVCYMWKRTA